MKKGIILFFTVLFLASMGYKVSAQNAELSRWMSTTDSKRWVERDIPTQPKSSSSTLAIDLNNTAQTIDGFGACFNELGWDALNLVSYTEKQDILQSLFNQISGAKFNIMRMPLGANDYAVDWYSFNETPGDYEMKNFSIARDRLRLIPYIKEAMRINPEIQVWASPWGPPSWMKTNNYYAGRMPGEERQRPSMEDLSAEELAELMAQFGGSGAPQPNTDTNLFIMDDKTLTAYGLYFSKFIEEYKKEGIEISAVHVQNEPNSAQNFPSCTWTPEALNTLVKYVGKQLKQDHPDVEVWLGTIERGLESSVDPILSDPEATKYLTGVGFQWAGKGVVGYINETYPQFKLMQTESECGSGTNDWAAMAYTFSLMKHYFANGVSTYEYWNPILTNGKSTWGWLQNSLVTVTDDMSVRYNPEFYLMKHFSYFVEPGAKYIDLNTEDDCVAFLNPNNEVVVIYLNQTDEAVNKSFEIEGSKVSVDIPANSLNTFTVEI